MNLFKKNFIQLFLVLFFILKQNLAYTSNKTQIIAKVGSEIITSFELENKIRTTLFLSGEKLNQKNINSMKSLSVSSLINQKLKIEELKKYNLKINDDRLNDHLTTIASRFNISLNELQNFFNNNQINYNLYLEEIKTEFLWQILIYELFNKKIKLDEDQIILELNETISSQKNIEEFEIGEIELDILNINKESIINEVKEHINQYSFEKAAIKYSISTSSIDGGRIGWINANGLSSKIYRIMKKLQIGNVSEPIISGEKLVFFKLLDKRIVSNKNINFTELKNSIVNRKRNELLSMYSNNLLSIKRNNAFIDLK